MIVSTTGRKDLRYIVAVQITALGEFGRGTKLIDHGRCFSRRRPSSSYSVSCREIVIMHCSHVNLDSMRSRLHIAGTDIVNIANTTWTTTHGVKKAHASLKKERVSQLPTTYRYRDEQIFPVGDCNVTLN